MVVREILPSISDILLMISLRVWRTEQQTLLGGVTQNSHTQ